MRKITVPGKPMTWSRARANTKGGRVVFFTPADREAHMDAIRLFAKSSRIERIEKPWSVALRCEFLFDRPDGHFGTGRNAGVLKERYRHARPPSGKNGGDLDNLVKLVKDALNSVAYHDDSQIAELQASKRYCGPGEQPETRIPLQPLENGDDLGEPEPVADQLSLAAA